MLIMLAGFGNMLGKTGAADAHDAGWVCPYKENWGQLMLMMLSGLGRVRGTSGS